MERENDDLDIKYDQWLKDIEESEKKLIGTPSEHFYDGFEIPDRENWKDGVRRVKAERRQRNEKKINECRALEPILNAKVVGIWGQLTGAGVRRYAIYKKNEGENRFYIVGKAEDVYFTDTNEERNILARSLVALQDGNYNRSVISREWGGNYKEIEGLIVRVVDPLNMGNHQPVRSIEQFLEER